MPAVKQVSFTVAEGETLVLLGTSGCGKTTTLKMINRLIEPDAGTIHINGENITKGKPENLRRGIGYVMQNIGLFPHYSVAENIAVVPGLLKWSKSKTTARIGELIEKLHLPSSCLEMFPHALSGGQQQRVGLARALVTDPPVLLMDEPFGALDNITRSKIQAEFKALEELKRKTIVMVTHDIQEAFELADRIGLMDQGELIQISTPKDLLYKPVNDFARRFLDGQRLAMEFKVASVKDIWAFLPDHPTQSTTETLPVDTDIWSAMEWLRASANDRVQFGIGAEQRKVVNFQELTTAFNQYQNKQGHV